jgi:hypothetical protein
MGIIYNKDKKNKAQVKKNKICSSNPSSFFFRADNCFLGRWGEYGPCQNGVMMKHRPVIAGGVECERKAVKAKPCS